MFIYPLFEIYNTNLTSAYFGLFCGDRTRVFLRCGRVFGSLHQIGCYTIIHYYVMLYLQYYVITMLNYYVINGVTISILQNGTPYNLGE
jgi:hypothetical protein